MNSLFRAAQREEGALSEAAAALLTDDGNLDHVAVKKWRLTQRFFQKWTHLGDRHLALEELPSDDDIREHFAVFETLFGGVVTEFFEVRHSIDDLLAEINATEGDDNA